MGSAALRDAIQGIIDWGETVGGVGGELPKATERFRIADLQRRGSEGAAAEARVRGAAPDDRATASRSIPRWPTRSPLR